MNRLSLCCLTAAALLSSASAGAQGAADGAAERLAAAERYVQAVSLRDLMRDLAYNMALELPEQEREAFVAEMVARVDFARAREVISAALARHFTVREIDALTAFMKSEEGRSVMKKMGSYSADVVPALDAVLSGRAGK